MHEGKMQNKLLTCKIATTTNELTFLNNRMSLQRYLTFFG